MACGATLLCSVFLLARAALSVTWTAVPDAAAILRRMSSSLSSSRVLRRPVSRPAPSGAPADAGVPSLDRNVEGLEVMLDLALVRAQQRLAHRLDCLGAMNSGNYHTTELANQPPASSRCTQA